MHSVKAIVVSMLAVLVLSGATCATKPSSTAYKVTCKGIELCMQYCKPLTDWTGEKDNEYMQWLLDRHSDEQAQCNDQRGVCADCIKTMRKAGVIE